MEEPVWECVRDAQAGLGEVPMWYGAEQALYWIDGLRPSLNRLDFTAGAPVAHAWLMPERIGSYARCTAPGKAVVALESGIFACDLQSGATSKLNDAPYDVRTAMYNDGRCDRAGRFWVGTRRRVKANIPDGQGWFYRVDDRGVVPVIDGITVANGIAWSPDDRTLYIADRPRRQITALDYDLRDGSVRNRRKFADIPADVVPDGAAVDSEGGYWSAWVNAGVIVRFRPDGSQDRVIKAPTRLPTMIAFGGPDLRSMFVTTALRYTKDEVLEKHAGGVFRADVGAQGLPEPLFGFL